MKINFEHNAKSNGPRETGLSPRQQDRARGQAVRARGYGAYVDGRDSIHPGNALGSRWNRKEPAGRVRLWRNSRPRQAWRMYSRLKIR